MTRWIAVSSGRVRA